MIPGSRSKKKKKISPTGRSSVTDWKLWWWKWCVAKL